MNKYLFTLTFLLFATLGFSQDTLPKYKKTVMVIPFNPNLYNNEASKDMIKKSGLSYDDLEFTLRMEFDRNIHDILADSCKSICLLQSYTTNENTVNIGDIYSHSNYYFAESKVFEPQKKRRFRFSRLASDKELDTEKDTTEYKEKKQAYDKSHANKQRITDGELTSEVRNNNDKFLNVKFKDDTFLKDLSKKFAVDYFLFINQFDIKGDFSNPYANGTSTNDMSIMIHYSIFNSNAEYIFGGVAVVDYPAYISDPKEVMDKYFAKLTKFIIKDIKF